MVCVRTRASEASSSRTYVYVLPLTLGRIRTYVRTHRVGSWKLEVGSWKLEAEAGSWIFGRTDLRISRSKAKFDARADGDVHLSMRRPKPRKIREK